jgi:hypothetical protein
MARETNTSLFTSQGSSGKGVSKGAFGGFFAVVQDTSNTDPNLPPGLVSFRGLNSNFTGTIGNAFPFYQFIKTVPLKGEIILIIPGPDAALLGRNKSKDYYMPALNMWNHPQHGASGVEGVPSLDIEFTETPDLNPMLPFPGDLILEGRKGQSIRFSENFSSTPWQGQSKNNSTIAIVSGQTAGTTSNGYVVEDINNDPASIYLLANQTVPLLSEKSWKRGHLKSSYPDSLLPVDAKNFIGNQVVINSGRLYFNAREENILLSANQAIGLLGERIHIDAENAIHLDAPILRLTGETLDPTLSQAAVRGNDLVRELESLYRRIDELTGTLALALTTLNLPADKALELKNYTGPKKRGELKNRLLSKRVFLS